MFALLQAASVSSQNIVVNAAIATPGEKSCIVKRASAQEIRSLTLEDVLTIGGIQPEATRASFVTPETGLACRTFDLKSA
jgi:hypothetical protein